MLPPASHSLDGQPETTLPEIPVTLPPASEGGESLRQRIGGQASANGEVRHKQEVLPLSRMPPSVSAIHPEISTELGPAPGFRPCPPQRNEFHMARPWDEKEHSVFYLS